MGYNNQNLAFTLTPKKLKYWHRFKGHKNLPDCIFCNRDFEAIAQLLVEKYNIEVISVGSIWLTIFAPTNFSLIYGVRSDETDLLFHLISGDSIDNLPNAENSMNTEKENDYKRCCICGGKLICRNGKFGRFLGCSNFPKCRYTKNL
jgi:hypothetical protein